MHRDIKVENIVSGEDGFWKVIDLGSSSTERIKSPTSQDLQRLREELKQATSTLNFPPEVIQAGLSIDCSFDIWGLGCLMFTLMYHKLPFREDDEEIRLKEQLVFPSTPLYSQQTKNLVKQML
mmetsp:Transcript_18781/g.28925  ORF Transcript_18781/g.28925 Transcript_18781/m.28925 type:complete len:123 (+) Transcript_18781:516-884(+)